MKKCLGEGDREETEQKSVDVGVSHLIAPCADVRTVKGIIESLEQGSRKGLCADVRQHIFARAVDKGDDSVVEVFFDVAPANENMFAATEASTRCMHGHRGLIVLVDDSWLALGLIKSLKKCAHPWRICRRVRYSDDFVFC